VALPYRALAAGLLLITLGVDAQSSPAPTVLRIATLSPRTRVLQRGLARWNRQLAEATDGRVQARVYWGGSLGDERTLVRRMRLGTLDGAHLTSTGLGFIEPEALVFSAPGLLRTYAQVDRVREGLRSRMEGRFRDEGFELVEFGDSGRVRLFSAQPVRRPGDLRRMRPWQPSGDRLFSAFLAAAGANGVRLGVGEVRGGLSTGTIDVVPASALAVGGLQWFDALTYATAQTQGFLLGAFVMRRASLDGLAPEDREAVRRTALAYRRATFREVRDADERVFAALVERGAIRTVDVSAYAVEWEETARRARQRLAGRVYPASLLRRVEALAAGP
jgi:TRAP-type C4-dicarboxylate transport system substrate-binding protein